MRPAARLVLPIAVLAASAAARPAAAQPASDARLAAFVDSVAGAVVRQGRSAGLSVAVARGGAVVLARGYGLADVENAVPVTDASVFRIASVTKQFTAAAVLQLAEQGRLSLDDTLQRWVPDWPRYDHPILLRHLLSHTSGLHDWTGPTARPVRLDLARDAHDSVLAPMRADAPHFAPGASYEYANVGYHLLGLVVERASGQAYADYLAEHLLRPLGLTGTTYCEATPVLPHRAHGYAAAAPSRATPDSASHGRSSVPRGVSPNAPLGVTPDVRDGAVPNASPGAPSGAPPPAAPALVNAPFVDMARVYSAGALCSTARDLATWARALASGRVVGPASYRRMTTPAIPAAPDRPAYGFGAMLGALDSHPLVSHGGRIDGFTARLASYPADSLAVVVLANTDTFAPDPLEHVIAARALGVPDPAPADLPVTATEAGRFTGVYRSAAVGFQMEVRFEGGTLVGIAPGLGRMRLRRQDAALFVDGDDPFIRFRFAAGPRAERMELSDPQQTVVLVHQ